MTTLESREVENRPTQDRDEPRVAIKEARRRQRRRWIRAGLAGAVMVAVAASVASVSWGTSATNKPTAVHFRPSVPAVTDEAALGFQVRPVLCYAPPYQSGSGAPSVSGSSLPVCGPPYLLTESQIGVIPNGNSSEGFTANNVLADPAFAGIPSTAPSANHPNSIVLLRGLRGSGPAQRYVLGPATLTSDSVASASAATSQPGAWIVNVQLTGSGSTAWDNLTHQYFHRVVAIVWRGLVFSAPINEPTNTSFISFNGRLQISGSFTAKQARAFAAAIMAGRPTGGR